MDGMENQQKQGLLSPNSTSGMPEQKGGDPESKGDLSSEEEIMADTAFGLTGAILFSKPSRDALLQAVSGNGDPAAIVGNFISQITMKAIEKTQESGPEIAPSVWLAQGGVVERLLSAAGDLIETESGKKFGDKEQQAAFGEVVETLKAAMHSASNSRNAREQQPGMGQQPMGGPPAPMMAQGGAM